MGIAARLLANGTFISSSEFDEVTQSTVSVRPGAVYAGGLDEVTGVIDAGTTSVPTAPTGSISFNGTNQRLQFAPNTALNITGGAFTMEAWVKTSRYNNNPLIAAQDNGGSGGQCFQFVIGTTGKLNFLGWTTADRGSYFYVTSTSSVSTTGWTHVAATYDGSTIRVFVNGNLEASTVSSLYSANVGMGIGNWSYASYNNWFIGNISNFRIVKGTALYTASFTPSTTALTAVTGTQLLIGQSTTTISDASPNALTFTNDNSVTASTETPFVAGTGTASTLSSSKMRQVNGQIFIAGRFIEGQDSVLNTAASYSVNYLAVAGGGGGSGGGMSFGSGGGGAGGMLTGTTNLSKGTTINISVGRGGATGGFDVNGERGANSSIGSIVTAIGGGAGTIWQDLVLQAGGSGGGINSATQGGVLRTAGSGIAGQGKNGAIGFGELGSTTGSGGGGGGAGSAGVSPGSGSSGGNGGTGSASSITGSAIIYAAGGSGGGSGSGSQGSRATYYGSGGGGGAGTNPWYGSAGLSGIVVLSIPTENYSGQVTGATVSTSGTNTILSFTTAGANTGTYVA